MTASSLADTFLQAAREGRTLHGMLNGLRSAAAMVFLEPGGADRLLSYSDLAERSREYGAALQQQGVRPGEPVLVCCEDERSLILGFWAVLQAGGVAVPLPVPATYAPEEEALHKLMTVHEQCGHGLILTDLNLEALAKLPAWRARVRGERCLPWPPPPASAPLEEIAVSGDDLAMLMFSSGSTGDAKGVRLTHRQILTNLGQTSLRSELAAEDVSLSWLPLTHDMGLVLFHLCHTLAGLPQYKLTPYAFVRDPLTLLKEAQRWGATVLGMPNFGFDLLVRQVPPDALADLDLGRIRIIYNGAEPIEGALCRKFYAHFEPAGLARGVVNPGYGIAEACVTAAGFPHAWLKGRADLPSLRVALDSLQEAGSAIRLAGPGEADREVVSLGPPVDGMTLAIVDDRGRELPEGCLGRVFLSGPNVTQGYWGRPDLPVCDTGDRGFLWEGSLYLTGREKDILFIHGRNHYSNDLEHRLCADLQWPAGHLAVVGVTDAGSGKERVVVFYREPRSESGRLTAEHFRGALEGILAYPVAGALKVSALPKTTSGKVRRFLLRQALERGDYDALLAAQETAGDQPLNAGEARVAELVREILPGSLLRLDPRLHLSRYGLDSVGFMQLAHRLGQRCQREVPFQALLQAGSLQAISAVVEGAAEAAIPARALAPAVPLSPSQSMLWVATLLDPEGCAYQETYSLRLAGELRAAELLEAIRMVLVRHPMLCARIQPQPVPRLVWDPRMAPDVDVVDVEPAEAEARMEVLAREPLDLEAGPLIRVRLLHTGARESHLFLSAHHLVVDGWSLQRLVQDIFSEYAQPQARGGEQGLWHLPAPADDPALREAWGVRLDQAQAARLPGDSGQGTGCGRMVRYWPGTLLAQVRKVAQARGAGLFPVTMAALGLMFQRIQGVERPILGTLLAGRRRPEDHDRVGYFAETVPMVVPPASFGEAVDQVQAQLEQLLAAPPLGLDLLAQLAGRPVQELLEVVYVHQNTPQPRLPRGVEVLSMRPYRTRPRTALYLTTELREGRLEMAWEYDESRYSAGLIRAFAELFEHQLRQLCLRPEWTAQELRSPSPAQAVCLAPCRDRSPHHDLEWNVVQRFEARALRQPGAPALTDEAGTLSYGELHQAVQGLSQHLRQSGVLPGDRLCLLGGRSRHYVTALMAALHAGAIFVPMDPALPAERMQAIIADSDPRRVVATADAPCPDFLAGDPRTLPLADLAPGDAASLAPVPLAGSDGAYIIYTSGSTGTPKGVLNDHKSLANLVAWVAEAFAYAEGETICQFAPFSFDVSLAEILPSLCAGLHIHLLSDARRSAPEAYLETLAEARIRVATLTPAYLQQLLLMEDRIPAALASLRLLILGGESLRTDDVVRLQSLAPWVQLVNVYGPTETTVLSSWYAIPQPPEVLRPWQPLGRAVANTELLVLDDQRRLCPLGVTGEIHIGGQGLAQGYWRDDAKTAAAFATFSPDGGPPRRFYRTGDLARLGVEGALEFVGRNDHQVKVRGFRIELGEVETALEACPGIRQAVVVRHPREAALVAYYCGEAQPAEQLQARLRQRLPEYMIPGFFQRLEAFPLTPNRKVDRAKLPAIEVASEPGREAAPPQGAQEESLAALWKEVLGSAEPGREDSFFHLGGHSLSAARLAFLIRETFGCDMPLPALYQHPTLRAQAAEIQRRMGQGAGDSIPRQAIPAMRFPATEAQARMVFLQLQDPTAVTHQMPLTLALGSPLEEAELRQALRALVQRHPVLRSRFELGPEGLEQVVLSELEPDLQRILVDTSLEAAAQAFHRRPFQTETAPLWRCAMLVQGDGEAWLALNFHHALADGVTLCRFLRELDLLLRGESLPDLAGELGYADYACWQQGALADSSHPAYAAAAAHWREEGARLRPPDLPLNPKPGSPAGRQFLVELPEELGLALDARLQAQGLSPFALLLGAFGTLLSQRCGPSEPCVGITVGGRRSPEVAEVMGLFVNTLPLRFPSAGQAPWAANVRRIQGNLAGLMAHQDYPLNRVMAAARLDQVPFNVLFNQEILPADLSLGGVSARLVGLDTGTAKFPLLVSLLWQPGRWSWRMEYRTDLLGDPWVETLAEDAVRLLRRCAAWPELPMTELAVLDEDLMALL